MKLRNTLAISYTILFSFLLGITFISIYYFSRKNRAIEFHQRFMERTLTTFRLITELHLNDNTILPKLDKNIINNLRENTLLFDSSQNIIYSSNNDIQPEFAKVAIASLKPNEHVLFLSDNKKEILVLKFKDQNNTYYGVAGAEDKLGKKTTRFLLLLLLTSFSIALVLSLLLSYYLSGRITSPITKLTKEIGDLSVGRLSERVSGFKKNTELDFLADKFNEMLDKVENSFKFQHHFINHISHELKTPLAIMMANAETVLSERNTEEYKKGLQFQKDAVIELSNIINTITDITKTEVQLESIFVDKGIRIDELLFDCIDTMVLLNSSARFDFNVDDVIEKSELLLIDGNNRMLKIAFSNLIKNAINYSADQFVKIEISSFAGFVEVLIINNGLTIDKEESKYLFKDIFRGKSSTDKKGFGLGLVLTNRIITLHKGIISYYVNDDGRNCFSIQLPLGI